MLAHEQSEGRHDWTQGSHDFLGKEFLSLFLTWYFPGKCHSQPPCGCQPSIFPDPKQNLVQLRQNPVETGPGEHDMLTAEAQAMHFLGNYLGGEWPRGGRTEEMWGSKQKTTEKWPKPWNSQYLV